MVLYEDRIQCWEKMTELDVILDDQPDKAGLMVTLDIRNRQAFDELSHYQSSKSFLYQHPLLLKYKLKNSLDALRKADPERFMKELINASKAITRYESMIKTRKYKDQEELNNWNELILSYQQKLDVMKTLIS